MTAKDKVIVALDYKELDEVKKLVLELGDKIGIYGAISLIIDNLFVGEKLLKL